MRRTVVTLLMAVVAALAGAPGAWAGHSFATANNTYPGMFNESELNGDDSDPTTENDEATYWRYYLHQGRSYVAFCFPNNEDNNDDDPLIKSQCQVDWFTGAGPVGSALGATAEPLPAGGDAASLTADSSGYYVVRVDNETLNQGRDFGMVVLETTLFSPWYFVSASDGYEGFIEVKNNTDQNLPITITVYDSAGSEVGTPHNETLAANGNSVVPISANFPVSSTSFGSVQISHSGMYGAAVGNITTLSALTGLSFDAAFETRQKAQASIGHTWGGD